MYHWRPQPVVWWTCPLCSSNPTSMSSRSHLKRFKKSAGHLVQVWTTDKRMASWSVYNCYTFWSAISLDYLLESSNPLLCYSISSVEHILIEQYEEFYGRYGGFYLLPSYQINNFSLVNQTSSNKTERKNDRTQQFIFTIKHLAKTTESGIAINAINLETSCLRNWQSRNLKRIITLSRRYYECYGRFETRWC